MKKTLLLLLISALLVGCGSDNDGDDNSREYTSFQIKSNAKEGTFLNVVSAYRLPDNTLKKISELGDIAPGQSTDEIIVDYTEVKQVEVFFDTFYNGTYYGTYVLATINIEEDKNNVFTIPAGFSSGRLVDKSNPEEYPQD